MIKLLSRRAIWAGLAVMGLSAPVFAASSTGLGQAWPNAQDVSASTHWHVYVFTTNGVRYVQINDLSGDLRVAYATAKGQFLVLPMGRDAQRISTPQQPLQLSATVTPMTSYAETIYRDGSTQLTAVPLSDGTTMFTVSTTTTTMALAPCDDPDNCSSHSP